MDNQTGQNRSGLDALIPDESRNKGMGRGYSRFVKLMRIVLPLAAVGMMVVVLTWEDAGRRVEPVQKQDIAPQSKNIQNELLRPVFNSIDQKNQPYTVTADAATQDRINPDIVNLTNPKAELTMEGGVKLGADAKLGLYEQKTQKLNLSGDVHLNHSDGYRLSTEELRIDLITQKTFSGRDVRVEGPAGSIDATGLEGDGLNGTLIFTGPAKVILYSEGLKPSPQEN